LTASGERPSTLVLTLIYVGHRIRRYLPVYTRCTRLSGEVQQQIFRVKASVSSFTLSPAFYGGFRFRFPLTSSEIQNFNIGNTSKSGSGK